MQKKQTKKADTTTNAAGELRFIPLSEIEPPANNVRKKSDKKKFAELVKSAKDNGIQQAILVRLIEAAEAGQAKYQIVAGDRRFRAATEAGLAEIPAYVKVMDDAEALNANLVENLHHEEVDALDEADGFLRLKDEVKLDVRGVAARVTK